MKLGSGWLWPQILFTLFSPRAHHYQNLLIHTGLDLGMSLPENHTLLLNLLNDCNLPWITSSSPRIKLSSSWFSTHVPSSSFATIFKVTSCPVTGLVSRPLPSLITSKMKIDIINYDIMWITLLLFSTGSKSTSLEFCAKTSSPFNWRQYFITCSTSIKPWVFSASTTATA